MSVINFKLAVNVDRETDVENLRSNIESTLESNYDFSCHENEDKANGWELTPVERSGPRMEIFNHDDEPKCIRVFDDHDPICDVFEDSNVVFLASSTDAKDMQLVVNIAANFNFFYNSL